MVDQTEKPKPEKITGSVDMSAIMVMLLGMKEENNKNRQEDKEEIKGSIESLKKEISINYEIVNKTNNDNKINSDGKVENMEKQLERLREGNNTRFKNLEEQTAETKQDVRNLENMVRQNQDEIMQLSLIHILQKYIKYCEMVDKRC